MKAEVVIGSIPVKTTKMAHRIQKMSPNRGDIEMEMVSKMVHAT